MTPIADRWRRALGWLGLVVLALALHLVGLGERSYHHDEAIHAKLSWDLAERGAYAYDPTYHGPVLYYLTALTYLVVGDSDFTARLPIAFAGVAMVAVAWSLRRRFGGRAAWWTGLLVTVSPLFLYYGRFLRMDVLEALFASAAFVAWLGVVRDRPRSWAWLGVWTGLAFATKENAYVTAALVVLTAGVLALGEGLGRTVPVAWRWLVARADGVALSLAVFVLVTVPLYTVGFTRLADWAFPYRAIAYWWGQHTIQRVAGPWWFHLPRLAIYEGFILLAATVWMVRRRGRTSVLERALYVFGVLSIAMYIYLGEKVPWLGVHQVWPFLPLAGAQLARTFGPRGRWWSRGLAALGLAYTVLVAVVANFVLQEITPASQRVEALHFVQTSPEVKEVVRDAHGHARDGEGLVAAVSGEAAWPLSWYWRSLPVAWSRPGAGQRPPLVVCDVDEEAELLAALGPGYVSNRIPLRAWWLMENGDPSAGDVWRYVTTRRPWGAIGSTDVVVLRRVGDAVLEARAVDVPAEVGEALGLRDAEVMGEGWIREPRGVDLRGGRLAVADPAISGLRVVDADRRVTAPRSPPLMQPEDAAWLDDDTLVVADTWNHRVLIAGGDGVARELPKPEEGWYGPRSVAVSADGWLAVSDTGHHRVVVYDPERDRPRRVVAAGDAWGELLEPGGVGWLSDGSLVVCDTGHRRLVHFEREGRLRQVVPLPEAWPEFYSRPQIAVVDDATWLVSDTPAGALWLVRSSEVIRLDWPDGGPTGVAVDPVTGTLAVADLGGRVWLLGVGHD
jgi:uncharacterized protein (TIGR03663 family)